MKDIKVNRVFAKIPKTNYVSLKKIMITNDTFHKDDRIELKVAIAKKQKNQKNDNWRLLSIPIAEYNNPMYYQNNIMDLNLNVFGLEIWISFKSIDQNKEATICYY